MTTIRVAHAGDGAAIGGVLVRSWQAAYRGIFPDALLDALDPVERGGWWERRISSLDPSTARVLIAEHDGAVVGFSAIGPALDAEPRAGSRAGMVYTLYLDPRCWGHGIGRTLFAAAEAALEALGYIEAVLWVAAGNGRARRFHDAAGWSQDGATQDDASFGTTVREVRYRSPRRPLNRAGDVELIGGDEQRAIVVVDYDPQWPAVFELHRARISDALGARCSRIDHVGSTAVPGLAAKAIVDIQISVDDPDDEASYVPMLEAAGYRLRVREAGHRMLRTPELDVRLHVCGAGSDWERRHLLFRDWLRRSDGDRSLYESTKRELAHRSWSAMQDYADAKSAVIAEIIRRAERSGS